MTRSTPSMSSLGKMLPQSTTTMSSSYSKTVMFLPISSTPPRLTIRRRLAGCAAFVLGVIPSLSFKRFRFFSFTYFHHGSKKAIFSENCCWTRQACVSPNPISIISMPGKNAFYPLRLCSRKLPAQDCPARVRFRSISPSFAKRCRFHHRRTGIASPPPATSFSSFHNSDFPSIIIPEWRRLIAVCFATHRPLVHIV